MHFVTPSDRLVAIAFLFLTFLSYSSMSRAGTIKVEPDRVIMFSARVEAGSSTDPAFVRFENDAYDTTIDKPTAYGRVTLLGDQLVQTGLNKLLYYNLGGALIKTVPYPLNFPGGIESDSSGNLYIANPDGADGVRIAPDGTETLFNHPDLRNPDGIDADAEGNVYIIQSSSTSKVLFKFLPNGQFDFSIPLNAESPGDIAIDEARGMIYMADGFRSNAGIKRYRIQNGSVSSAGAILTSADIVGVFFDPIEDTVLAVDFGLLSGNPRGFEYGLNGTLNKTFTPPNTRYLQDVVAFRVPEPTTAALAILACCSLMVARQRALQFF